MGKSEMLRAVEVRDAFRLIGECRDLGNDPERWYPRMLTGLRRLIGDAIASGGEGLPPGRDRALTPLSGFESGMDARERELFAAYAGDDGQAADPLYAGLDIVPGGVVTRRRSESVPDAVYYCAPVYEKHLRPSGVGHRLVSVYLGAERQPFTAIHLHRASTGRDFSPREQGLLRFFHQELGPLVGRALVSVSEPSPEQLPPRLRQTLAFLLEGDSEKQVAARLGLSAATTHQYVTALYRRFGVQSRAQLMAHALKRIAREPWRHFGSSV